MNNILSTRNLTIVLLTVMAMMQAFYIVAYVFDMEREDIKNAIYHKVKSINISLQSSIEFLMRTNETDQVKVKITELGADPAIKYVLLIDQYKNVFASTDLSVNGENIKNIQLPFTGKDIATINNKVDRSLTESKGDIWTTTNNESVVSVYPVAAFSEAKSVRASKQGSIMIVHDLSQSVSKTYGLLTRLATLQLIGLFIFGIILYFIVFRRISIIRKNTEKISEGDYDVSIPISGNDELSLLAETIEDMSSKVNNLLGKMVRSEETFSKAQEIAHIGSWDWDILTGELNWSDEIYRIFGLAPQEFGATYDAFLNSVYPNDIDKVTDAVNAAVADPNTEYYVEHRVIHPDGIIREVQEQGKVYRNDRGEPIRMIGTVLDITDRKLIEQDLADERNFINTILESAGALVLVLDKNGHIVRFNNTCEKLSGYTFSEVNGKHPWDVVLPKKEAENIYNEAFKQLVDNPEQLTGSYTNHWISKDDQLYLIEWANNLLLDADGNVEYVVSTGIDITIKHKALEELETYKDKLEHLVEDRTAELKDAQDELIRKERLATLGQLTATVSHELRNPLGAMSPSLYVIQKLSDPEDERLQQALARVERNIERCDRIIDELLDFTRIDKISPVKTQLNSWLSVMLDELDKPDGILIEKVFSDKVAEVSIDTNVFRRAIINVYDNACHSMQDELKHKTIAGSKLTISTMLSDDRVNIVFEDTGCGMSDEVLRKIFEPLYSTKGFGVGLGMPTVMQIMEQHYGGIDVETKPNVGTSITLWLPVSNQNSY